MNKKQELNAFIKECITKALINLMEKKSFDDITITELVEYAGVSRVSFYRNFESKNDVLEKHLQVLWREWSNEFEKVGKPEYFSESVLKHFYKYKELNLLLYKQGLSFMVYEMLRWSAKLDECETNIEKYGKSLFAGLIFGAVDEWIRQGMNETPEEIILLTSQIKPN